MGLLTCISAPSHSSNQAMFWTNAYVLEWLRLHGLDQYSRAFQENGVDGETLLGLKPEQFGRCFGIYNQSHINSLRIGLRQLKSVNQIDFSDWEWSFINVQYWLRERNLDIVVEVFRQNAVHGGYLFQLSQSGFRRLLGETQFSELVHRSLWLSVCKAKKSGTSRLYPEATVLDWGPIQISRWLEDIDLAHLTLLFRRHGINGTSIVKLKEQDLRKTMGLTEVQTLVLMKNIRNLRSFSTSTIRSDVPASSASQVEPSAPPGEDEYHSGLEASHFRNHSPTTF